MTKHEIVRKLTSRKMWLAVSEFVSMMVVALGYAEDTATQIAALIMAGAGVIAYIIGEGLADAATGSALPGVLVEGVVDTTEE